MMDVYHERRQFVGDKGLLLCVTHVFAGCSVRHSQLRSHATPAKPHRDGHTTRMPRYEAEDKIHVLTGFLY